MYGFEQALRDHATLVPWIVAAAILNSTSPKHAAVPAASHAHTASGFAHMNRLVERARCAKPRAHRDMRLATSYRPISLLNVAGKSLDAEPRLSLPHAWTNMTFFRMAH